MTDPCNQKDAARSSSEPPNADLEEQVRRRTAELEDANRALREIQAQLQRISQIGEFGIINHKLGRCLCVADQRCHPGAEHDEGY